MEKNELRKNILIIGGLTFVLLASVIAIYFSFFREPTPGGEQPTFGGGSAERATGEESVRENNRRNRDEWSNTFPRLVQITAKPVSGATTFLNNQDELVLRYAERQTSHIYDVFYDTFDDERISNETIPRVHEALFGANGENAVFRYLGDNNQTIRSYSAELAESEDETQTRYGLEGGFLVNDIPHIDVSPGGDRVFWMTESPQGSQSYVSHFDGSEEEMVFASDFSEWLPQWLDLTNVLMTTRASGYVDGHAYVLDTASGALDALGELSGMSGLTTLAGPGGTHILFSRATPREFGRVRILNTETGETDALLMRTLPEKCAWGPAESHMLYCGVPSAPPEAVYPDAWYQGKILFTDTIWEINAQTGEAREIYDPRQEDSERIDVYRPTVSEDGEHVIFNNKRDMSLWSFRIEEDRIIGPEEAPEPSPGT